MQSINRRIKIIEQHRAASGNSDFCSACHSYIGTHPTDIKIVPPDYPKCNVCGSPRTVRLNLGRKVLNDAEIANMNHDEEIEMFMEQIREMTEE